MLANAAQCSTPWATVHSARYQTEQIFMLSVAPTQ
jgi:hypothetical protein